MANSLNINDEILRVFIQSDRNEMTLTELHNTLASQFMRITTVDICEVVRSQSLSNLFQLQPISTDSYIIQLSPKLTLCEGCLRKSCKSMRCPKLHLCAYPSHFPRKPYGKTCGFPHKLHEHPNNRFLLSQYHFDTLNEDLLLDLLRIYYKSEGSNQNTFRPISRRRNEIQNRSPIVNESVQPKPLRPSLIQMKTFVDNVVQRQLAVSVPSERDAPDIDLELIELLFRKENLEIEPILSKQISNDFYRRFTLQFKTRQEMENLLQTKRILFHNNISIKMKRTERQRDKTMVVLKFETDKKIDQIRLKLYVEILIGDIHRDILDMTPDGNNEQIFLIQCEQPIDFDHLYKVYSTKNTLQNFNVVIKEIYETEIVEVSFPKNSKHPFMTIARLRQMLGEARWQQDVFACIAIYNQSFAELELMNTETAKKWLMEANKFHRDLSLLINPVIDFVKSEEKDEDEQNKDEDKEIAELFATPKLRTLPSLSTPLDNSKNKDIDPNVYTIKPEWRVILTHPVFAEEYRKYIRENLNISVQITGSTIPVADEHIRKELARFTNMFIQKFVIREVSDLNPNQVQIMKRNYSKMAHKWDKQTNKTIIAAHRDDMNELIKLIGPTNQQQNKLTQRSSVEQIKPLGITKPPTPLIPETQRSPSTQFTSIEDNQQTIYTIGNNVLFPFFAPTHSFSNRLQTYLQETFNIQSNIKMEPSVKVVLELIGQTEDVSSARTALRTLFAAIQTKNYVNTKDTCRFSIPDIYRVAQSHLDQHSIISSCSFSKRNGGILSVRYFAKHPQFGADEKTMDQILLTKLFDLSFQIDNSSKTLEDKFNQLEKKIQDRTNYGINICCSFNFQTVTNDQSESSSIYLCGLKPIIQEIQQKIKEISDEYQPNLCQANLESNQIDFLLKVYQKDLNDFENEYEDHGVDICSKLQSNQFLAPKRLHEKIKLFLLEKSQIKILTKEFETLKQITKDKTLEFENLAFNNQCLLTIKKTTTTTTNSEMIRVINGDLTTQKSDVLVICSSSANLFKSVIQAAGTQVQEELSGKDVKTNLIETSSGELKQAKRLLFVPWLFEIQDSNKIDKNELLQSIKQFVQISIQHTIKKGFQSIAFPAIGCGGYGFSVDLIATAMIDAVREEIQKRSTTKLDVTFVIQQTNVFDAFNDKIKRLTGQNDRDRFSSKIVLNLLTSNVNVDKAKKILSTIENFLL